MLCETDDGSGERIEEESNHGDTEGTERKIRKFSTILRALRVSVVKYLP